MNRILMATLATMVLAAAPATAQQDADARIEAAKRRVSETGVPVSLLESRIAEGRAKGVPLERIAAVVERRATALAGARQAMTGARGLTEADLSAGADALEAGIDGQSLGALAAEARAQDRPVAIAVLTYLHREGGLPVGQALQRVRDAMGKGPEALRNLPAQAQQARQRGGPPGGMGNGQGMGRGQGGGPPAGVPAPGHTPGAGKPDGVGRPDKGGPPVTRPGKPGGGL